MSVSSISVTRIFIYMFIGILAFTSCTKEGPAGSVGPAGAQGPEGTAGVPGSVDIINSEWIALDLNDGIYYGLYYGRIDDARITQAILDKGVIKMYVRSGSAVYDIPNPTFANLYMSYSVGKIEIFSPTDWDAFSGYSYRFVLIPAS